ncbi:MAG: DinB family protein [Chloroflexia bacterium]
MTTPPRLAPILAQFEFARGRLLDRLVGLTDDEYLWEPVPGCWSIRPRAQVAANRSYGSGAWQLERAYPEPEPAPFTTLAWRLCHLASGTQPPRRLHHRHQIADLRHLRDPPHRRRRHRRPHRRPRRLARALTSATDADLDRVGHSIPLGPRPHPPFLDITWWVNQELLHHGGEIALLRDLYRLAALDPRPAHRTEAIDEHRHRVLARHHLTSKWTRSQVSPTMATPGATSWPNGTANPASLAPSPISVPRPCSPP